jgi:NAD(P)-dependent dehydrogenase (short-subunit alcohol dehydrogenase family)
MDVNYFGTVRMIKSALPLLKQSKESRIVNVSSLAGLTSMMYMGAYCASKHAVEGMTKALRSELRPWNIHVCNVNPGFARTPMIAAGKLSAKDAFSKASREIQYQYNDSDMDSIAALVESNAIEPALVVSKILSCVYAPCPALNNIVNGYLTLPTRFISSCYVQSHDLMCDIHSV